MLLILTHLFVEFANLPDVQLHNFEPERFGPLDTTSTLMIASSIVVETVSIEIFDPFIDSQIKHQLNILNNMAPRYEIIPVVFNFENLRVVLEDLLFKTRLNIIW